MNTKLINIDGIIKKIAVNNYQLKTFVREWQVAIVLIFGIRITTMLVSGWSGYGFLHGFFMPHIEIAIVATIISIVCLVCIEILTYVFLDKAFKFIFHGNWQYMIFASLGVAIMFILSFYTTTQGLSMRQYVVIDKSAEIMARGKLEIDAIKINSEKEKQELQYEIEKLSKNTYKGKLDVSVIKIMDKYKEKQFAIDDNYNYIVKEYNEKLQNEVNSTKTKATIEAEKYFNIAIVIITLHCLSGAALMYFWQKIYFEMHEAARDEEIDNMRNMCKDMIWTSIFGEFKQEYQYVMEAFGDQRIMKPKKQIDAKKIEQKRIGFAWLNKNQNQQKSAGENPPEQLGRPTVLEENQQEKNQSNLYGKANAINIIKRHPDVVKSIVTNVPENSEWISNDETKIIRSETQRSRSLIRDVYNAVIAIGYSRIDVSTGKIKEA